MPTPVPPLSTESVPEIFASVVVATHVFAPSMKARTYPGVPAPKSVEVATERASAVEPVGLPKILAAATCARLANGRSPVIASPSARSSAPHA